MDAFSLRLLSVSQLNSSASVGTVRTVSILPIPSLLQLKLPFISFTSSHRLPLDSHSFATPLLIAVAQEKLRLYGRPLIKAQTPSCDCPSFQPQLRQNPQTPSDQSRRLRECPNPPLIPKRPPLSVNDFPGPDLDLALTLI